MPVSARAVPGEQGEVGEADPARLERGDTRRERLGRRAGGDGAGGGVAGHGALVADPVDRRGRALGLVLLGGGKHRGLAGEAELEQIDAVAEPDQTLAQLVRGELHSGPRHERFDRLHHTFKGAVVLVSAITHPWVCIP
jgi:hypothetical protein